MKMSLQSQEKIRVLQSRNVDLPETKRSIMDYTLIQFVPLGTDPHSTETIHAIQAPKGRTQGIRLYQQKMGLLSIAVRASLRMILVKATKSVGTLRAIQHTSTYFIRLYRQYFPQIIPTGLKNLAALMAFIISNAKSRHEKKREAIE